MKLKNKLKYEAPTLRVIRVEAEEGIAAASATISGGDSSAPYQPVVEDWQDGGFYQENGDL